MVVGCSLRSRRETSFVTFIALAGLVFFSLSYLDMGSGSTYSQATSKSPPSLFNSPSTNSLTTKVTGPRAHFQSRLRPTKLMRHGSGFNVIDNLYMVNGTFYVVTDVPAEFPHIKHLISNGKDMGTEEENAPTDKDMKVISLQEASDLFRRPAVTVDGVSFICNDTYEFLAHYYHVIAEVFFGMWRIYASLDLNIDIEGRTVLPDPRRFILPHSPSAKDRADVNGQLLVAAFPGMSGVEGQDEWKYRILSGRPFHFERVVLGDRGAAHRGTFQLQWFKMTGEAFQAKASKYWWEPIRRRTVEFFNPDYSPPLLGQGLTDVGHELERTSKPKEKPLILYISRQGDGGSRRLKDEDHDRLVTRLTKLAHDNGYEFRAEKMAALSKGEQIRLSGRADIMLGVHGNGLTHLLWLPPHATLIEIMLPGGFTFDYAFTAMARSLKYFTVWDDKVIDPDHFPKLDQPPGFHGSNIPANADAIANLCQKILSEKH